MAVDVRRYRIAILDPADERVVEATYDVHSASRAHDLPDLPAPCRHRYGAKFRRPTPGTVTRRFVAYDADQVVGVACAEFPQLDNVDNVWCEITVHPRHRRRGAGRALYDHVVTDARAAGRTRIAGMAVETMAVAGGNTGSSDVAGGAFARSVGAEPALVEVRRKLDLTTVEPDRYEELLAGAWRHTEGYSLVRWRDRAPDEYVADIAYLDGRLGSDAPMGDLAWEPEKVDAVRIRGYEETRFASGMRSYHSAVRHEASHRVVAWSVLSVERSVPEHAWQGITIVDPPHRGHRLGTIVKLANVRHARADDPQLRTIDTWNASVNDHMIAINDAMGFRPVDVWVNWQVRI